MPLLLGRTLTAGCAALALACLGATVPTAPTPAAPVPTVARYVPPLTGPVEVRHGFDPPALPWGSGHRGVDLAAAVGQEVRSPGPGTVTFAGPVAGRGVVTVAHPDGLRSSFEPVSPDVVVGDRVTAAESLGTVAPTPGHCAPSSCLHWGVRHGDDYRNPLGLLRSTPTVLLPGP